MTNTRGIGTVVAAAILLLLSTPFAAIGAWSLNEILVRRHTPGGSGGVFEVFAGLGVGLLLVAAIHVGAAAVLIWRGSLAPARRVGLVGMILGGAAMGLSLFYARDLVIPVLPFPLGYGAAVLLIRDRARSYPLAQARGVGRGSHG